MRAQGRYDEAAANEPNPEDTMTTIRAILENGAIRPLEELPAGWHEGQALVPVQVKGDSNLLHTTEPKGVPMSQRRRRHFSPDEKATILRRHLSDKVPVSDLSEEYKLQPSVFYQWQRQLLDNAAQALEPLRGRGRREKELESKIEVLETRLRRKDNVIAEISEEFVKLKKELGEP